MAGWFQLTAYGPVQYFGGKFGAQLAEKFADHPGIAESPVAVAG